MRLIDADALQKQFDEKCIKDCEFCPFYLRWTTEELEEEGCCVLIQKVPTIDAAPVVHAEWIPSSVDPADPYFHCSNCRHGRDTIYFQGDEYNFCPNCGAKMDGDPGEDP